MRRTIQLLFLGFLCWFIFAGVSAQSVSLPTDPARPSIITGPYGKTVGTADGELFRGTSVFYRRAQWANNGDAWHGDVYYKEIADSGFNAVRVSIYDPGLNQAKNSQEHLWNVTNFGDPDEAAEYLSRLDSLVDKCSKYGIYVLLNSHMVLEYMGEFRNRDAQTMGYQKDMWKVLANHYKDRTHVFFESLNEPKWLNRSYLGLTYDEAPLENATYQLIDSIAYLYELIHDIAPNTHQVLFSFAAPALTPELPVKLIVDEFDNRHAGLVDWSNASVGFHPYANDDTSAWIVDVMSEYPTLSTESNWPLGVGGCHSSPQWSPGMDGEKYVAQTFERIGVSWFQWTLANPDQFECNFPNLYNDAKSKGYLWFGGTKHTLDITYNSSEGSVHPGGQEYYEGREAPLEALPALGYKFSHWSGDINSNNRIERILMDGNKNVTANFVATSTYTLSTNAQGEGSVKVYAQGNEFNANSKVYVKAIPDNEYTHKFSHWTGNVPATDLQNQYITMDANKTITAHFMMKPGVEIKAWITGSTGDEAFTLTVQDAIIPGVEVGAITHWGVGGNAFERDFTEFTTIVEGATNITPDQVKVHFINNKVWVGKDKNLMVDKISIDGVVYETESDDVVSYGAWKGGLNINQNLSQNEVVNTEWLFRKVPVGADRLLYFHYGQGTGSRYTLNVDNGTNGNVIPGDNTLFLEGEEITVEANPSTGYSFSHWSGDLSGSQNPVTLTMSGNKSITAHWLAATTYNLSTNTGFGNGSIVLDPAGGNYNEGLLVTATAEPDPGYIFSQWKGDLDGDIFSHDIAMSGNKTITADFSKVEIPQTNSAPSIDGLQEAAWNDANGYSVTRLVAGGADGIDDASILWKALWDNDNLYVFLRVNDDAKVKEDGSWYNDDVAEIYIDADNSKSSSYGSNDYQYIFPWGGAMEEKKHGNTTGVDYSLIATNNGYNVEVKFPWSTLGVSPSANDFVGIEIQLDDDDDYDARDGKITWFGIEDEAWRDPSKFGSAKLVSSTTANQYVLSSEISGTGDVVITPVVVDGIYNDGQEVTLIANDLIGSEFGHWSGDASGSNNSITLTMDANKNVTANYNSVSTYTLSTDVNGNGGSVEIDNDEGVYNNGTEVNLSAVGSVGHNFSHWTGDLGGANSNSQDITVTMDANRALTAHFVSVPTYTLNTVSKGNVRLEPAGGVYNEGTVVTATAKDGYKLSFNNWSGDASGSNKEVQLTMNGNRTITANYTEEAFEKSAPLPTDAPRLKVEKNPLGYTIVRGDNGEILRGSSIVFWKGKFLSTNGRNSIAYAFEDAYYQAMVDSGQDAIRLNLMDPYYNTYQGEYTEVLDFSNPNDLEWVYSIVDSIVDLASKHNMYVILDYHDVGEYRGKYGLGGDIPSIDYLRDFWTALAPRYRDRTHVAYELVNEPVFTVPEWTEAVHDSMARIYEHVRYLAPETHILNFSISGPIGLPWNDEVDMRDVARVFEERHPDLIDWSNASISFHPYHAGPNASSEAIVETMAKYPVFNSESNFNADESLPLINRDKQVQSVDGEAFINQTMERLGIGWLHWKISGWDNFNQNYPLILKDAREKDYIWFGPDKVDKKGLEVTFDDEKGDVTPGAGLFAENSIVNLNANGLLGFGLDYWSGDIGSASNTDNPISITMDTDKSVTAHFKPVSTYELTTDKVGGDGSGSVILNPEGGVYNEGTEVTLEANISTLGYAFDYWSGDIGSANSTDNPLTVNMNADKSITANFKTVPVYTISTTINGGGAITLDPAGGQYTEGTTVKAKADPDNGQLFIGWGGAASGNETVTEFVVNSNLSLTAGFTAPEILSASSTPTIDGTKESTWNGGIGSIDNVVTGGVADDSDLSGSWTALWDNNNLYLFVDVVDNVLIKEDDSYWKDDAVEVFIDADNSRNTSYGANDYQYAFRWNDVIRETKHDSTANVEYSITGETDGYHLEVKFPWSTLLGSAPSTDDFIGFEVHINDDDNNGDRDGKKAWYGTEDNAWNDPSKFAEVKLVDGGISPTTYTLTTSATNGDISLNPTSAGGVYDANTTVTATANADAGYYFAGWEGASTSINSPVDILMDSDKSLTATFNGIMVNGITIAEGDQSKEVGDDDFTLTVNVTPSDALNPTVDWASTDENVATVTSDGVVSIVAAGTADISATSTDGSNVSDVVTVTVTDATPVESLTAAYAFGTTSYTRETPNKTGTNYVKVQQTSATAGPNLDYTTNQGYGYIDKDKLDNSPNNRNGHVPCGEELYEESIAIKYGPGDIVFQVDVPNGDYKFVAAMGDAQYTFGDNRLEARDGSSGTAISLIDEATSADEFAIVKFGDKNVPACSGLTFIEEAESGTLTVTDGNIQFVQSCNGNGAGLIFLEIWSVDGTSAPTQHTLTVTADPTAGGTVSGTGDYDENTNATAEVTSVTSGYTFDGWSDASTETTLSTTIYMDMDKNATANFSPILVSSITIPEGNQSKQVGDADFTLTASVSPSDALNPTVDWASTDETVATVTSGGVVSIVAAGTADISATSTDGSNVSGSVTVTVTEVPIPQYTLTTTAVNGSITLNPTGGTYDENTTVTATAQAYDGYHFTGWEGASNANTISVDIVMDGDKSLTANFAEDVQITLPDPLAWYKFEGNGNDSQNSYDGVLQGSPSFSSDSKEGSQSIVLNGIDQWMKLSYTEFKKSFTSRTVTAWVKADNTTGLQNIYEEGGGTGFAMRINNGTLEARARSGYELDVSASYTSTSWKHVVARFDAGNLDLFIDGSLVSSDYNASFASVGYHSNEAGIGHRVGDDPYPETDNAYFDGLIDDVRIYDVALTNDEVTAVYDENKFAEGELLSNDKMDMDIRMYPNPTSKGSELTIELLGFENETGTSISIVDLSGKVAYNLNVETRDMELVKQKLNLNRIPAGMYMVIVKSNNKLLNQKLIVK